MAHTITRSYAERLVIRYALTEAKLHTVKTRRERDRISGVLEGIAEAADIAGLVMTPFAFRNTLARAIDNPAVVEIRDGWSPTSSAGTATAWRVRYQDALIAAVRSLDTINLDQQVA